MILIFDINRRYAIYYLGLKKREKTDDSKRKEIEKSTKEISEDKYKINLVEDFSLHKTIIIA